MKGEGAPLLYCKIGDQIALFLQIIPITLKKIKMDDVIRSWPLRSNANKKLVFLVCQQVLQFYLLPIGS